MLNQKNQDEKMGGVNPVVAAVTVAVVGAGIAVAGTMALKDKKNRDEVKEKFVDVKKDLKKKIVKAKKKMA